MVAVAGRIHHQMPGGRVVGLPWRVAAPGQPQSEVDRWRGDLGGCNLARSDMNKCPNKRPAGHARREGEGLVCAGTVPAQLALQMGTISIVDPGVGCKEPS
jgi:hypothetical protein